MTPPPAMAQARERRGMLLGLLGVTIFALTMPMTRLAVGDASEPRLSPWFVTWARAAMAGLLSIAWLAWVRAPWPGRHLWRPIAITAAGTVVGFPLFLALALRHVESMHAAVVTGVIPLATAAIAALWLRQRASVGFWACAVLGCALVLAFAMVEGGGRPSAADALLLAAVLSTGVAYVSGARVSTELPGDRTVCWVLVMSLPLTVPAMLLTWPQAPVHPTSWAGLAYVTLFSMWLGFFAWYRGLAMGGVMRVSQVQLLQPFIALLAGVPILGERLDATTMAFALAVIAVVFVGRRMPIGRPS